MSKTENLNVFYNIAKLDKKHRNFFQLKINKKVVDPEYLERYFATDIGQLSLKSILQGIIIKTISISDLRMLTVALPPLKTQQEITSSYRLMDNTTEVINTLSKDLSLNPKNAITISEKLTNTLDVLNRLTNEDKVLSYIRKGENLTTKFKQTFSTDIKTGKKEKYIEASSLKNIAGFLNKEGGILLVGIEDNGEIWGIEKDHYVSDDKYLLHFKDKVKTAIGEEFFSLINYEIVPLNGRKVLLVECKKLNKPVYIDGKDFYVRTNPATDKLEGPKLVEYINIHFTGI